MVRRSKLAGFALLYLAAALGSASTAGATTITFDMLPDEGQIYSGGLAGNTYTENGITVTSGTGLLASHALSGAAHIDDSGTPFTSDVTFTMATPFDATGFSLLSRGYALFAPPPQLLDNVFVTGLRGGSVVASTSFAMLDTVGAVQNILLDDTFGLLDALRVELAYVYDAADCDAPCAHFDLTSATLVPIAPVPVPAGGLMLAGLLLGLGMLSLDRRRAVTARV
jgi:hypothetical protein